MQGPDSKQSPAWPSAEGIQAAEASLPTLSSHSLALLSGTQVLAKLGNNIATEILRNANKINNSELLIGGLIMACLNGNVMDVRMLLAGGANVNAATNGGDTPLSIAASWGYADVVKLLLAAEANVNTADNGGFTPLHEASFNGHADVVKLLLAAGANVNATINGGFTPLHEASNEGHAEVVKLLLTTGANVNAVTDDGFTPLFFASLFGNAETVKILLAAGGRREC